MIIPDKTKETLTAYKRGYKEGYKAALNDIQLSIEKQRKDLPYSGERSSPRDDPTFVKWSSDRYRTGSR